MWRLAARYSAVGIEMAAAVAMGTGAGWWLDSKLGTDPVFLIFGIIVGIGAAAKTVIRIAKTTKLDEL
jgi:F0F1-type ATP synthase assembly protein I